MKIIPMAFGLLFSAAGFAGSVLPADTSGKTIVLDDFEADVPGQLPGKWRFLTSNDRRFKPLEPFMGPKERFVVVAVGGNKFLRAYTEGEAQRISLPAASVNWKLTEHPRLAWEWRARRLPSGASEDKVNDVGGAVYVSFSKTDWLGRPLSIKYTYSSALPVGTVVSTGNVKIIVASSKANGINRWVRVERDVVADYERVFGAKPPIEPYTVTLWSDSDNTKSVGEVDFDNLTALTGR